MKHSRSEAIDTNPASFDKLPPEVLSRVVEGELLTPDVVDRRLARQMKE